MRIVRADLPLVLVTLNLLLSWFALTASARQWTSSDGKTIDAELVRFDGSTVTLLANGKEYALPLSRLSVEDQAWLQEQAAKEEEEKAARLKEIVGLRTEAPIEHRYAASTEGYFEGPFGDRLREFYDTTASIVDVPDKGVFMDCAESVAWKGETMTVFCPPSYERDGSPHGVYINIAAGKSPIKVMDGCEEAMERLKMIYASPSGTSNADSDVRRMALALDTLATLRKTYAVDDSRVFVGGSSGGGAISAVMGVNYPEFRGVLCQVRNFDVPHTYCVPYVEKSEVPAIANRKQAWAWITGPEDRNHDYVVRTSVTFESDGFVSMLFDIPGMKHQPASADTLEKALRWAEASSAAPGG